jgi:AraC-like DNA-binding protein
MNTLESFWPDDTIPASLERLDAPISGISVALFSTRELVHECTFDSRNGTYLLSVQALGNTSHTYYRDGKLTYNQHRTVGEATMYVPGQGSHRYTMRTSGPSAMLHFYLPARLFAETIQTEALASHVTSVDVIGPLCASNPRLEVFAREAVDEMKAGMPFSRLRLDALGQDLVIELLRTHSNLRSNKRLALSQTNGTLAPWQIRRVCDLMMTAMEDGLPEPGLVELAAAVDLTPNYLCRAFSRSEGMPPHRWMSVRRIERAKVLMSLFPKRGLTEIAIDVGYADQSAFARAFHRITGSTPSVWRSRAQ